MPASNLNQNGQNVLANANDAITIILTNNPLGQDGEGSFTLSPGPSGYVNAQIIFEWCLSVLNFQANIWSAVAIAQQQNPNTVQLTNATTGLLTQGVSGIAYNFTLLQITGYYAVRMRLVSIVSGSLIPTGLTVPATTVNNPNELAALQQINTSNLAQTLGLSMLTETDLMAAVGGSF